MLPQMCKGLELHGLHEIMKKAVIVPGRFEKQPDADFLTMALSPILSEMGSVKQRESQII